METKSRSSEVGNGEAVETCMYACRVKIESLASEGLVLKLTEGETDASDTVGDGAIPCQLGLV